MDNIFSDTRTAVAVQGRAELAILLTVAVHGRAELAILLTVAVHGRAELAVFTVDSGCTWSC